MDKDLEFFNRNCTNNKCEEEFIKEMSKNIKLSKTDKELQDIKLKLHKELEKYAKPPKEKYEEIVKIKEKIMMLEVEGKPVPRELYNRINKLEEEIERINRENSNKTRDIIEKYRKEYGIITK